MDRLTNAIKDSIDSNYRSVREFALAVDMPYTTIKTALEKGFGGTAVEKVIKICCTLNIDINDFCTDFAGTASPNKKPRTILPLSVAERRHIDNYRNLDNYGRDIVDSVLDLELKRLEDFRRQLDQPKHQSPSSPHPKVKLPLFTLPASAGRGVALDTDVDFETIAVEDKSASREASFAIKVSGDSMEPEYFNGDVLLVKNDAWVDEGDLGIFVLNGEGYFKEFGGDRLISYNDKYDDILITADDSFYVKGRVLGKA